MHLVAAASAASPGVYAGFALGQKGMETRVAF